MSDAARLFHSVILVFAIGLFATAIGLGNLYIGLYGVFLIFVANVLFACLDLRSRLLFLFFHFGLALFLLSRPFVAILDSSKTWELSTINTTWFALWALFLSMFSLFVGSSIMQGLANCREKADKKTMTLAPYSVSTRGCLRGFSERAIDSSFLPYVRKVTFILFFVCLLGAFALGYQKLSFMQGLSYEDYFMVDHSAETSLWARTLETMLPYMLCAYLATFPKKAPAVVLLLLNIIAQLPMFIIGERGPIVLSCIFLLLYFAVRELASDKRGSWIGKKEWIALIVALPVGVVVMGLWNYVRAESVSNLTSITGILSDTLHRQGVTFSVLGYGYDAYPRIASGGFKFYSAGLLTEYISQGPIGQYVLGLPSLEAGHSAQRALEGSWYADAVSYYTHPNYLAGESWGSTYLLELYTDFGYGGIVVFSLLFGAVLCLLTRVCLRGNWFAMMLGLLVGKEVFFTPRDNALGWIEFIWTPQFWFALFLVGSFAAFSYVCLCRTREMRCLPSVFRNTARAPSFTLRVLPASIPGLEDDVSRWRVRNALGLNRIERDGFAGVGMKRIG